MTGRTWVVSPSPFVLTRPTVPVMSVLLSATIFPILVMLVLEGDYPSLSAVALSLLGSFLADICMTVPFGRPFQRDGTVFVTGLLTGLLLPSTLGYVTVFTVALTGTLFARAVFGGTGSYWISPVATSVAIAFMSQPSLFPPQLVTPEGISMVGDAFGSLKLDGFARIASDTPVTEFLNGRVFSAIGVRIPEGYVTLLWRSPSAIPAFRYNSLILVSSVFLIALNVIDWIIPLVFVATYSFLVRMIPLFPFAPSMRQGDILFALLTSGILFTAFYILPEFSTSPRSRAGKIITGIVGGVTAFFICGPGGSPGGAAFSVLATNAFAPLVEYLESHKTSFAGDIP